MSATKFVTLWCDGHNCNEAIDTPEHTSRDARKWAEQHEGWHCPGPGDWCPEHRPPVVDGRRAGVAAQRNQS